MNAWDNLPNGPHIDRILAHLRAHPELWPAAKPLTSRDARHAAWDAAWDAAWHAAWHAAWDAAWDAARHAAWDVARHAARHAAWDAICALIAWDDCTYMLDMPTDALRVLAAYHPAAVLILPANITLKV